MASIITMLMDAADTVITAACQTAIPEDDLSRANLVRSQRLQDDPSSNRVSVLIYPNDPENPGEWRHELVTDNITAVSNLHVPIALQEIGGGGLYWNRFMAEFTISYVGLGITRDEARSYAHQAMSRAKKALNDQNYASPSVFCVTDEFGESGIMVVVKSYHMTERGGEGEWMWSGKIWFQVLTGQ